MTILHPMKIAMKKLTAFKDRKKSDIFVSKTKEDSRSIYNTIEILWIYL